MSKARRKSAASLYPSKKDAKGNAICCVCEGELPKRRSRYCSDKCVDEMLIRTRPDFAKSKVYKRDKGICANCGADTSKHECPETKQGVILSPWHMDHIIPVAEGGGCCGLDNLQTLCIPCHKEKTREMYRKGQA